MIKAILRWFVRANKPKWFYTGHKEWRAVEHFKSGHSLYCVHRERVNLNSENEREWVKTNYRHIDKIAPMDIPDDYPPT